MTDDHRMLLRIRETLYEGSWDDFVMDLTARCEGRRHVFDTVPDTPAMRPAIQAHLELIRQMRTWESKNGTTLTANQ